MLSFTIYVYIIIGKDNKDIDWYVLVHFEVMCAVSFFDLYVTIIYVYFSK